jgi:hypothetical protein
MNAIAMALMSAVIYLDLRGPEFTKDSDIAALKEVAFALKGATPAEIEAVVSAATAYGFPWLPKELGIVPD